MNIHFISLCRNFHKALIIFCLLFGGMNTVFASGNADVTITTSTSNGSWSFASSTYTWTPNADGSNVDEDDITACLLGTGTIGGSGITDAAINGAGSVTILTACSGTGTQTGNVTISSSITAATTNTTQMTFRITAAGTITNSATVNMTPASNAGDGYPATNVVFTGPSGISGSQPINCTGGASSGTDNPGGAGGSITLNSSGGAVSQTNTLTTSGAGGGTGSTGASYHGGAGGALTITGTSISLAALTIRGGAATGTGNGGAGGTVTMTATSTTITLNNTLNTTGGVGGTANGAPGNGGAGGSVTLTAATDYTSVNLTCLGGAGAGNGDGGAGGNITVVATAGSIAFTNTISSKGGASGASIANQSGGAGGTIVCTAGTTFTNSGATLSSQGGTCRGTGSANGANITITAPSGLTISQTINANAGTGGAAGTAGNLTINDGNSTITSGGANDGQGATSTFSGGNFTKTGSGNFQLLATNNWTGSTIITDGKLTLGAATVIPNASGLNFNGGRLVMGAFDETVGTITVSSYSVLDLPVGNYTLTCSASNGVSWTAGQKLGVNNWVGGYDGTAAGGSDPKFRIGTSTELDAGHLAQLYFRHSGGSHYTATQLGAGLAGEIVPTGTLPVKLVYFDAKKNKQQVDITWQTASEINSDYFEIMRAGGDMQWESIGKIAAAGTSNNILDYSFTDPFPMVMTQHLANRK